MPKISAFYLYFHLAFKQFFELGTLTILILQVKKQSAREVNSLAKNLIINDRKNSQICLNSEPICIKKIYLFIYCQFYNAVLSSTIVSKLSIRSLDLFHSITERLYTFTYFSLFSPPLQTLVTAFLLSDILYDDIVLSVPLMKYL